MPRSLRAEQFSADEICIVHCVQRCVRRAFLAGSDPLTGKDFSHRREWIRLRMERLASVFGIDILTYAILSNHLHIVLRNRPDVVAHWSDRDVAHRWLRLFPGKRIEEFLGEPTSNDIDALANDTEKIRSIRERLSDPSWFMRSLCEPIARVANKEDECTGSFWEGRFKAQAITDEAGLLACSMYVDLNPIRAAMANSLDESVNTSAYDRIHALKGATIPSAAVELIEISTEKAGELRRSSTPDEMRARKREQDTKPGKSIPKDAWMAPLELAAASPTTAVESGSQPSPSGVRASDKGFLGLNLTEYLMLLDWTGRNPPSMGNRVIPDSVDHVLRRIGIDGQMWSDLVWRFKKYFRGSSAGAPNSMRDHAKRSNRKWNQGQQSAAKCFASG